MASVSWCQLVDLPEPHQLSCDLSCQRESVACACQRPHQHSPRAQTAADQQLGSPGQWARAAAEARDLGAPGAPCQSAGLSRTGCTHWQPE